MQTQDQSATTPSLDTVLKSPEPRKVEISKIELIKRLRECDVPMLATQNAF